MTCSNGGFINRVDTLTNHVAEEATRIFKVARYWEINKKTIFKTQKINKIKKMKKMKKFS